MRVNIDKIYKKQKGFTLVEVLIGLAVAGAIVAAAAGGVTHVFKGSPESNNRMQAINSVQNASQWITQDARNAEQYYFYDKDGSLNDYVIFDVDDNIEAFSLENNSEISKIVFQCREMDEEGDPDEEVIITYILNDDNTLYRTYNKPSSEIIKNTLTARYITSLILESGSDNGTVNIKITAELGNAEESRVYSILLRNNH
jgi:prepilin-type N-terminal cleavage/methylation domain-containing protein